MEKIAIAAYIWCLAFASASFAQVPDGERMSPELSRRIQNIDAAAQMERGEVVPPSYGKLIIRRVLPNIIFNPDDVSGNPVAEVEVRTAPDGKIMAHKLIKSSGNKAWDEAVIKALNKTDTLPLDLDGTIPAVMVLGFKPKEDDYKEKTSQIVSSSGEQITLPERDPLNCIGPIYPAMSKRNGEQGKVVLRVRIGDVGQLLSLEIAQSSGFERLDKAALSYVINCKYKPGLKSGTPINTLVSIPVEFKIGNEPKDLVKIISRNKELISLNLQNKIHIKYDQQKTVLMVGCRMGKISVVTNPGSIYFQDYLTQAFNEELKTAERFGTEGKLLNVAIKSIELSTLGKGLWEVELLVYLDDSNKVVVKTVLPFNQSVPTGAPCDNAKYVLPDLASEIIKSVFTDSRVLSIVN
jgi:TonB family protein